MPSRLEIRREAADRLEGGLHIGTATGGTTIALIDTDALLDSGESTDLHLGSYCWFTSGANAEKERRCASYLPASGQVTFGAALANAVAAGDDYELHAALSPTLWNRAIDRALGLCRGWRRIRLDPVADQRQYPLWTEDWLHDESQVRRVLLETGADGEKQYDELEPYAYDFIHESSGLALNLRRTYQPNVETGLQLVIEAAGPFDPLPTDAATTGCPLKYVTAATLYLAWEYYGRSIEMAGRTQVNVDKALAANEWLAAARKYAPSFSKPVGLPD